MNDAEWNELAHAVIDGAADEAAAARVNAEIAADPARAREFARLALLHDALERASTAGAGVRVAARRLRIGLLVRRAALVAAALAFIAIAGWFVLGNTPVASAGDVLARIVEVARQGDRTYILRAVGKQARTDPTATDGRPRPTIDGAILYLRAPASFVLARVDEEGREVLTGSDGTRAWSVPTKGPVRVSRDPHRFAGALPGSKQGIAFIDPHGDLAGLSAAYEISIEPAAAGRPLARLVAVRRSDARGGPKRIEIDFDPATAVIRRIRLDNLPQARGGPRAVEFDLVDDRALDPRFFSHEFHHDGDRAVIEED